jgi:hypothetical protein
MAYLTNTPSLIVWLHDQEPGDHGLKCVLVLDIAGLAF